MTWHSQQVNSLSNLSDIICDSSAFCLIATHCIQNRFASAAMLHACGDSNKLFPRVLARPRAGVRTTGRLRLAIGEAADVCDASRTAQKL